MKMMAMIQMSALSTGAAPSMIGSQFSRSYAVTAREFRTAPPAPFA